jgi:uncharacterized protein (TIGR02266 family)
MADDRSAKPAPGAPAPTSAPPAFGRPPRSPMAVQVRCRFPSIIDFVETQSVNVSREGMYLRCDAPPEVGSKIDFDVSLDDGFVLLKGSGIVVRVVTTGDKGLGMRFLELDDKSRKLINRIVEVNLDEGKNPTLPLDFSRPVPAPPVSSPLPAAPAAPTAPFPPSPTSPNIAAPAMPVAPLAPSVPRTTQTRTPAAPAPSVAPATQTRPGAAAPGAAPAAAAAKPIQIGEGKLRVVLNTATATFFSYNPLLNIRMGGFFIPVEEEVPLGTTYKVEIVDAQNQTLVTGKGKVVARQELRVGIRLSDVDKDALGRLQALVGKLASSK